PPPDATYSAPAPSKGETSASGASTGASAPGEASSCTLAASASPPASAPLASPASGTPVDIVVPTPASATSSHPSGFQVHVNLDVGHWSGPDAQSPLPSEP